MLKNMGNPETAAHSQWFFKTGKRDPHIEAIFLDRCYRMFLAQCRVTPLKNCPRMRGRRICRGQGKSCSRFANPLQIMIELITFRIMLKQDR